MNTACCAHPSSQTNVVFSCSFGDPPSGTPLPSLQQYCPRASILLESTAALPPPRSSPRVHIFQGKVNWQQRLLCTASLSDFVTPDVITPRPPEPSSPQQRGTERVPLPQKLWV